jgi:hypothetical protein
MTTVQTESYQAQTSQDLAHQRLAASRQDMLLYAHLLQASLVVEHDHALRRAISRHPRTARSVAVILVVVLSIIGGLLVPQLVEALRLF